jgi:hypothetical protein
MLALATAAAHMVAQSAAKFHLLNTKKYRISLRYFLIDRALK